MTTDHDPRDDIDARAPAADDGGGEVEHLPPALLNTGMAMVSATAEVNAQVETARRFPRRRVADLSTTIEGMATLSFDAADECIYSLPRSKKAIEGPSIRFAEIVQQAWGNCRVSGSPIGIDRENKMLYAEGIFFDCQTNVVVRKVWSQRVSDKYGRLYNDDMLAVASAAAVSKAIRNAILGGVPKVVWKPGYDAAEKVVIGDEKTLTARVATALEAYAKFNVTPEQVFTMLDVKDAQDITLLHIVKLRGALSALKNGEETVDSLLGAGVMSRPDKEGRGALKNPLRDTPVQGEVKVGDKITGPLNGGTVVATGGAVRASPVPAADQGAPVVAQATAHVSGDAPTNEVEYVAYARREIAGIAKADVLPWWKDADNRALRDKCRVSEEWRETLKEEVDQAAKG